MTEPARHREAERLPIVQRRCDLAGPGRLGNLLQQRQLKALDLGRSAQRPLRFSSTASSSSRNSGGTWALITSVKVPLCRRVSPTMRSVNVRTRDLRLATREHVEPMEEDDFRPHLGADQGMDLLEEMLLGRLIKRHETQMVQNQLAVPPGSRFFVVTGLNIRANPNWRAT